jgi:hypothetical protein
MTTTTTMTTTTKEYWPVFVVNVVNFAIVVPRRQRFVATSAQLTFRIDRRSAPARAAQTNYAYLGEMPCQSC